MGDRITISDVARRAGVSTGTVSAVINGRDTVRPRTRDKVLRVVSELGYRPALSARALASAGRRPSPYAAGVGVIVKEADNPFYTEVVSGIHETLRRHNLLALASATDGVFQTEGQAIEALRAMTVQGLIIGPVLHEEVDLEHLFALVRIRFPFVLLETVQGLRASSVSIDNVDGSKRAVAHLFEHGHRRVVHFSGPPYTQHTRDRIQGVREAFSESDQVFDPACIVPAGARVHDGYRTAKEYFAEAGDDRPTALTCFNDLVAIGAIRALAELGLNVPGDVSVIGCDDIPMAEYLTVPLTTVGCPKRRMGRVAAELLLRHIEDRDAPPVRETLRARLIERSSVRALH